MLLNVRLQSPMKIFEIFHIIGVTTSRGITPTSDTGNWFQIRELTSNPFDLLRHIYCLRLTLRKYYLHCLLLSWDAGHTTINALDALLSLDISR